MCKFGRSNSRLRPFTLLFIWNIFLLPLFYYAIRTQLDIGSATHNLGNIVLSSADSASPPLWHETTGAAHLWRGIVIYEADKPKYVNIFEHMLFNSWLYLLRVERAYKQKYNLNFTNIIDLIVVVPAHYSLLDSLPSECQHIANMSEQQKQYLFDKQTRNQSMCVVMDTNNTFHSNANYTRLLTGDAKTGYPFLNSIDCVISFEQQYPDLYYQYDYLLRTDEDVFLTPFFLYTFPADADEFIVGRAAYIWPGFNITRDQLMNVSSMLHLKHCREPETLCFNHGSTWYGSPSSIYDVAELTIYSNIFLIWLFDTNQTSVNSWQLGWYRGVSLLYASEIAINHLIIFNESKALKTPFYNRSYIEMDGASDWSYAVKTRYALLHLHTFNNGRQFSKFVWMQRKYDEYAEGLRSRLADSEWNSESLSVKDYCMAIAYDLHQNLSVHQFDVDSLLLRYLNRSV